MGYPIFEPMNWTKADGKNWTDFVTASGDGSSGNNSFLVFRKYLSPLSVYKYLVCRFGEPDGIQALSKKKNDSDNLIHWDFLILAGENYIYFQGGSRDVHVKVTGRKLASKDWVRFSQELKRDFARCKTEMSLVESRLQKWNLVSNRYVLLADACAEYHEILADNMSPPDFIPPKRTTERGIKQYTKQLRFLAERAARIFNSSISLDLLTPVLAESYINLLILILRKDDLITNKRQYDSYIRQAIDTRVFDLHLKCRAFKSGVDEHSSEYKNFKKVIDRRNNTLHGNIDPKADSIEIVFFDDFTPLYEKGGDPLLEVFRNREKVSDSNGVLERYHWVHEFIIYLQNLIEEPARETVRMISSESTFGFDLARMKFGRLFADHEPMMLFPQTYDDELNVDWRDRTEVRKK